MRKDPTEFRERFLRWKNGELVYENGLALPAYEDGKDANNVPSYTPSIDDREQPGYRKYLWELSKARRNAFLKEYGDAAPIKNYYEDFLSNSGGTFNYRRWYNLASPAERKYGLKKGLAHWRDADGKTSLHPSFSIESPYSGYKNPYNPKGITGGKWIDDDHYEFSDSQINNDWPINNTLDEFDWSRKEEGSNTYGYYKGGIMLREPTIIGKMPKYEDGKTSINSPILEDFADPCKQLPPLDEEPVLTTNKKLPDEIVSRKTFTPQDLKNDIRDFYTIDFVQRRRNYHPEESAEQITNLFNVSPILFGTLDSNTGGIHNKGNIIINNKLSDNLKRSTAVHEMRHVMDHQLERLTPEELLLLHKAYDLKADKDYLHLENEYPTTNTELRYSISKDHNNAVGKDLDNVIKNISDEDLILRASMINGYNKIPDKTIKPKNSKLLLEQKTKADAMRKALIEVAYNSQKQDDRLIYAKDGLTPLRKSEVNTNLATYNPEEDLYTGRYTLPEVTVTGDKSKRVYHSHAPRTSGISKNQYKLLTGDLLGAMTTGTNVLSPSLWWGAVRDANGLQDGFNRLMRGNSGFVTEDYAKDHPYISAGVNLVGDAVIGGIGTKTALETLRIANNIKNRNLFAYTYIPPYGYAQPVEKAKEYVSHILKDRLMPDPDNLYTAYNLKLVPTAVKSDGGHFAGFRDVAWRKYLGLNENSPLYVDNGDGTFSYNLDYILNTNKTSYARYLNPEDKNMFTSSVINDYVTGNGGNVASKIIYKPEGSYNRIEDIWDLHPFKSNSYVHPLQDSVWLKITGIADDLYSKNYYNGLKYKNKYSYNLLGGKLLNKLRYSNPPEWFLKSLQRFENMEMGPLLGGKPFTMRTDVPLFLPILK